MPALLNADPAADPAADPSATRPRVEVADIFRRHGPAYRQGHRLPLFHLKAMHAIEVCRTAALGGHLEQCTNCGFQRPVYNSCRNRNCPKCQALAKARWLEQRSADLLPVGYFHNVFTLPHELNALAKNNATLIYNLLFDSVAQTLQAFAADPAHGLGGQLGFTAVLHTWDQRLLQHIHLHCLIPGGALAYDRQRWLPARPHFLFPVRALGRLFRGKFLGLLQQAFRTKQLLFPGPPGAGPTADAFRQWLRALWRKQWIVYSKKPFGGPRKVLDYLGRYTHRIAISNHRLRRLQDGQVTLDYRDRRDGNRVKALTLAADEFIRRFLVHVVPARFCRIRHFGFLSNRLKNDALRRCRELLGPISEKQAPPLLRSAPELLLALTGVDVTCCPRCRHRTLVIAERLPGPQRSPTEGAPAQPAVLDSS